MQVQGPTLSPEQIAKVQDSFSRIAPKAGDFARDFYERLFADNPGVKSLFPNDMAEQQDKLVSTLAYVVKSLANFSDIEKSVRELGERHSGYRAEAAHYDAVGKALIATLQAYLGPKFDTSMREAWETTYAVLATTMLDAAERRSAA